MPAPAQAIALTMGDPAGIGAEVLVRALARSRRPTNALWHVFGCTRTLDHRARAAGLGDAWRALCHSAQLTIHPVDDLGPPTHAGPSAQSGARSLEYLRHALAWCDQQRLQTTNSVALVTAPISKHAWALAGERSHPGHTELLASHYATRNSQNGSVPADVRMLFVAPMLRVMLQTIHVPLSRVPGLLSTDRIVRTIELAAQACHRLGVRSPRVAVAGLNPHAGEAGVLGDEDERIIRPAVEWASSSGIDAFGPLPGDTVFTRAVRGGFDIVVAMYHDQGLIPVKLLAWDKAVNATIGLPIVRTSPDHGTAFDIADRATADPGSMSAAIDLALSWTSA